MLAKRLIVGIVLCMCCLRAFGDDEEELDGRAPKEYMPEVWHGIQTIPEGATGWIPRDPAVTLNHHQGQGGALTKRRRLRKRKRRPPIVTYLDQSAEIAAQTSGRPDDPWEEMQEESGRPNVRRKVTPAYYSSETLEKNDRKTPNIKDILKQSGGLSLSEILQQKNLTLSELLMGKKEAIQALTEASQTERPNLDLAKYKRIPPSIGLRKEGISRRYETFTESQDILSSRERMEAQKKRLALLQSHNYKGENIQEDTTRYELVAEQEEKTSSTTEPHEETTIKAPKSPLGRLKTGLPLTSAKLMKMVTKKQQTSSTSPPEEEENYPKVNGLLFKPLKISVKDILEENQPDEKTPDEPLRMSIDLNAVLDQASASDETGKLEPLSAREEILQLLADPVGRAGLARILEARNMSVQELIELRERGSSQLHLADIFHNNTREPEPSEEAYEGKISSEVFSSFPVFARQPKSLLSQTTEQTLPNSSTDAPYPWHQLFNLHNRTNDHETIVLSPQANLQEVDILTEEDLQRLDLENDEQKLYASISNEQLNIEETPWQLLNISSGVKSAIVASLVIVLLSIVVFVTILVVFKWRQSRKKSLTYGGSLKPALISIKRHNIRTFVAETLGKKNVNYYKRHLQSMSDDSWESDSKQRNEF